jgi:hypothetical protein
MRRSITEAAGDLRILERLRLKTMGYFLDRALFGKETADAIFAFRFLIAFIAMVILMIIAVGGSIYIIYEKVALEISYQHKYGPTWKVEFERYHGSLSEEHTHLAVAIGGILVLAVYLGWISWRFLGKHRRHSGRHNITHEHQR